MARQVPDLAFESDSNKLIEHYKSAFKEIVEVLSILAGLNDISYLTQQKILAQIATILMSLDKQNEQWCKQYIEQYFREGMAYVLYEAGLYDTLAQARQGVSYSSLSRHMVDTHISDTYEDLLSATKNTERKIKQLVKRVVSHHIRAKALQKAGRKDMERAIINDLTKAGLSRSLNEEGWVGIVDAAGRRWNLSTYVRMVTKTKLQQAHVEGVRTEGLERGIDLAVISSHGAEDACRYFEGLVISLNGLTPGYLTYEELRKSNLIFHPNCQHTVRPIRDIKLLPPQLRAKHEEQMKNAVQALAKGRRK